MVEKATSSVSGGNKTIEAYAARAKRLEDVFQLKQPDRVAAKLLDGQLESNARAQRRLLRFRS